jgi:hypothetical protein
MCRATVAGVQGSVGDGADRHASAEDTRTYDDLRDRRIGREAAETSRERRTGRDTSKRDDLELGRNRFLADALEDDG